MSLAAAPVSGKRYQIAIPLHLPLYISRCDFPSHPAYLNSRNTSLLPSFSVKFALSLSRFVAIELEFRRGLTQSFQLLFVPNIFWLYLVLVGSSKSRRRRCRLYTGWWRGMATCLRNTPTRPSRRVTSNRSARRSSRRSAMTTTTNAPIRPAGKLYFA